MDRLGEQLTGMTKRIAEMGAETVILRDLLNDTLVYLTPATPDLEELIGLIKEAVVEEE